MARKPALALALLGAMATSGCVVVVQEDAEQRSVAEVRISAKVCFGGTTEDGSDCIPGFVEPGDQQALIALRIPADATAPPTIAAAVDGGGAGTLAASASYAAELERIAPSAPGLRWAGYVSEPETFETGEGGSPPMGPTGSITADVVLPDASGLRETFGYQVLAGYRPGADPERDVVCDDEVGQESPEGTMCLDTTPEADVLATVFDLALYDVGLTGPAAPVTARPGQTASLGFTAVVGGTPAGVPLSASTTLPGGSATPDVATLTAAGTIRVAVVVPAGTAPGSYPVTLSTDGGAAARTATGTITVPVPTPPPAPADTTAPVLTAKPVKGQTPRRVARRGLKLRVTLSEAATVAGGLAKGKAVSKALPAGRSTLKLKLRKKPARALKGERKARLALALTATDAAGNAGSLDRKVKVKRPRR